MAQQPQHAAVDMRAAQGATGAATTGEAAATKLAPAAAAPAAATAVAAGSDLSALPTVAFWIVMSGAVILFNKALYSSVFPFPISLTSIHMASASAITLLLRATGRLQVPQLGWSTWFRSVGIIAVLYAASLACSNLGAARLTVSFVQMIKALTPIFTLVVGVLLGVESPSLRAAVFVTLMCAGVVIAGHGEIMWNSVGVAFQVTSVVAEASRLIVTQQLLQTHLPKGSSPLVSVALFAPPSFLLLAPMALWNEPGAFAALTQPGVLPLVGANTATAFTLNLAVVLLVGKTSGLTLTLAGVVKDIILILVSVWLFGNPVTAQQVGGYLLALVGLNMFNAHKQAPKEQSVAAVAWRALTSVQMVPVLMGTTLLLSIAEGMGSYVQAVQALDMSLPGAPKSIKAA